MTRQFDKQDCFFPNGGTLFIYLSLRLVETGASDRKPRPGGHGVQVPTATDVPSHRTLAFV